MTFSLLYNALLQQTKSGAAKAAKLIIGELASILIRLLPPGGTTGQALLKLSNTNYHVGWVSIAGGAIHYRQFVYNLDGAGDFQFVKLSTGEPVTVLLTLE